MVFLDVALGLWCLASACLGALVEMKTLGTFNSNMTFYSCGLLDL
jgi:hypothetical protein